MANATGKRIDNWLRLKSTKELLDAFSQDFPDSSDLRNRPEPLITLKGVVQASLL